MTNTKLEIIGKLVQYSVPVRDGMRAFFLEMPDQNIWYALLVVGIIIWAYKKPNKQRKI